MWVRNDDDQPIYVEYAGDCCVIKIERWEHRYYVSISSSEEPNDGEVPVRYFYSFQDARMFLTSLRRLIQK